MLSYPIVTIIVFKNKHISCTLNPDWKRLSIAYLNAVGIFNFIAILLVKVYLTSKSADFK